MKKHFITLAACFCAVLTIGFTSCSGVDEDDIIGTWNATKITYTESISGLTGEYAQYNGSESDVKICDENYSQTVTFKSDHTMTVVNNDEGDIETLTGTWKLDDDKLITTTTNEYGETESETMNVEKLDGSKLILSATLSGQEEFVPGQIATYSFSVRSEYTKQ